MPSGEEKPSTAIPNSKYRTLTADTAAAAYLETFAVNGVDYLFNSPGTEYAPLWEEFAADSGDHFPTARDIGYVACRHEELAMHAAMAYGMLTGFPQVVALHVNVGTLHAAMSIHGAYRARIPLVILASHADTHEGERSGGTPGSHYLNFEAPGGFEDHFTRYTKWVAHPEGNENAADYLARAFRVARTPPQGPVLVNLSRELLYETDLGEVTVGREAPGTPPAPGPAVMDELATQLEAAANPLIIAGRAGRNSAVADRLVSLAERLQSPVIESPKWHHSFPTDHPLSLGARTFVSHYLAKDVDLVLLVDSKRPWYPPMGEAPTDADILAITPDASYTDLPYWNYPVDGLITGDPAATLDGLLSRLTPFEGTRPVDWPAEHEALRDYWRGRAQAGAGVTPIDPFWLSFELDQVLPDDAVIVEETIVHQAIIANLIGSEDRRFLSGSKTFAGGIGGGLGLAFGATLAEPDRPVVALMGDGSFNYNPISAAFGAAQEHGRPFLTILFDNQGYRSQQRSHREHYPSGAAVKSGRYPGSLIKPKPDYAALISAWDGYGATVEDPAELASAVRTGLDVVRDGRPALVDVIVEEDPPDLTPPGGP